MKLRGEFIFVGIFLIGILSEEHCSEIVLEVDMKKNTAVDILALKLKKLI